MSEVEQKKVYSLNLAAFLLSKGVKYEIYHKDSEGNVYFVFEPCGRYINEYRNSKSIQNFISWYKKVREIVKEA